MNIWSRLGVSVAIAALFCILLTEFCQQRAFYQAARWYGCGTFIAAGIAFATIGLVRQRQRRQAQEILDGSKSGRSYAHFLFWGPVLFTFGAIILFIPYRPKEAVALPVAARSIGSPQTSAPPASVIPPVKEESVTNAPLVFPDLKIQGVVLRSPKNAVIVSGRTYFVGDFIGEA